MFGLKINKYAGPTVDLVISASLDFHEFVIFRPFAKSRIRELSISMTCSAIIIIKKFASFFNS